MRRRIGLAGIVIPLVLVSSQGVQADPTQNATIPSPTECSVKYILDNDSSYYSSAKYSMTPQCERLLGEQVLNERPPTLTGRYAILKIQADKEKTRAEGVLGLKALCEVDRYPRACSAVADFIQMGIIDGGDSEFIHFVTPAAEAKIPQALNMLALFNFAKFKKTNEKSFLCAALNFWRRGSELDDRDIAEMYAAAKKEFGGLCIES